MERKINKKILYMVVFIMIVFPIVNAIYHQYLIEQKTEITDKIELSTEPTKIIAEETMSSNPETEPNLIVSLGEFKLTAYCSCQKCCGQWAINRPRDENGDEIVYGSIGIRLIAGVSIAVDPNVIPYNTEVIINGHTYKAQDCGGAIDGNEIDVYFDDHQEALNFGVQYTEVFIIVE